MYLFLSSFPEEKWMWANIEVAHYLGTIWHLKTQQFFPLHDTILEQFIIEPNQPMEKVPKHKIICRCVQNK